MRAFIILFMGLVMISPNINAEFEMHIPNCTQKGVENCGGFLFDNETGDVLFCGSENCIDLKLPKSWRNKQADKQSKQDQIIEILSNLKTSQVVSASDTAQTPEAVTNATEEKQEVAKEIEDGEAKQKVEKCDKDKKSLCKGSGGMQLGGIKMKLKK